MSKGSFVFVADLKKKMREHRERESVFRPIRAEIEDAADWRARLVAIRRLYAAMGESWVDHDPYIDGLANYLTPIESALWTDIRTVGHMPMLMQVPVGRYFVDFGDLESRIALEADGKEFHNQERDAIRDEWLWINEGWRVFRVSGAQCMRVLPERGQFCQDYYYEHGTKPSEAEIAKSESEFLYSTSTGVVTALREVFYDRSGRNLGLMVDVLHNHRLADFPIPGRE